MLNNKILYLGTKDISFVSQTKTTLILNCILMHLVHKLLVLCFALRNLKMLKAIWSKEEVKKNQYILEYEFEEDCSELKEKYDVMSLYEPY